MTDNEWDTRYSMDEYVYGTAPNDWLAEVADRIPPGPVLCLADGEGRNSVFLAERGHAVTAVDGSRVGLDKGQRLARERGVSVTPVHADLAAFAIDPAAWSGIVSIFAHVLPAVRRPLHRGVVAGLRPGGVLVLEAYTPDQLGRGTGGPPTADRMMTVAVLRDELDGLRLEVAREREREVVEGRFHGGMASVVQVLGFRPA